MGLVHAVGAAAPVASFIANSTGGSVPLTVEFTDTSTGDLGNYWSAWDFGDRDSAIGWNVVHTYSSGCYNYNPAHPGLITVTHHLCKDTENICTIHVTHDIQLAVPLVPISSFTATPSSGPAPLKVQFTDMSSNNPTQWSWQFGDGTTSSVQNSSHTYTISGVFTVTLQTFRENACMQGSITNSTITVFSPLASGTTTSPTPTSTQTTSISPTTTTATSTMIVTTIQTTEPTTRTTTPPTTSISTPTSSRTPTSKVTLKTFTPYPTDTPTQPSPLGVEIGITAMIIYAVLVVKRK
jgi:PKD repeat protein